jgi:two-component system response regulator DesR
MGAYCRMCFDREIHHGWNRWLMGTGGRVPLQAEYPDCRRGNAVINVLVAQDTPLFRGAIAALLRREADMEVVAEVSDRREVVSAARACRPDVSVLDLAVLRPDRDSGTAPEPESGSDADPFIDAINLCRTLPHCRSLIVLDAARSDLLRKADEAVLCSVGFVTRKASPEHLLSAVRSLANGHPVIDPELVLSVLADAGNPLTPRERTVLSLAAEGAGAREIANRLFLSAGTVRNCLSRINVKTGSRNRVQAIHRARRAGWI